MILLSFALVQSAFAGNEFPDDTADDSGDDPSEAHVSQRQYAYEIGRQTKASQDFQSTCDHTEVCCKTIDVVVFDLFMEECQNDQYQQTRVDQVQQIIKPAQAGL